VTSSFGIDALHGDLEALADATADPDGLAGDIVQLTTRVVNGMRFGLPKLEELDDGVDDDAAWVAIDNSGELIVVGPEFMLTADGEGTSATIVHGSMTWTLHATDGAGQSWRVTAFDGAEVAADVTVADGEEVDHRDTDAINEELAEQMRAIVDEAVEHEERIFDAAESGQTTTPAVAPRDTTSAASPAASGGGEGGGPDVGSLVAGTAATMAAGAVVSRARKALSGRPTEIPPPPPWQATHVVPAGGISAWAVPDGRLAPVATLAAGVPLALVHVQGPWAEVVASNGWRGWVDATRLLPAPPS
jgi:hypothetical protein